MSGEAPSYVLVIFAAVITYEESWADAVVIHASNDKEAEQLALQHLEKHPPVQVAYDARLFNVANGKQIIQKPEIPT